MEKTFDFDKIGKRMPYSVPDDFLDKMEENIMQQVKEEQATKPKSHKKALHIVLRSVLAVAATVALFFVVQPLFTKNETGDFESVELAFNNLSVDDQDYLLAIYENDEFINYLTNTENEE